MRCYEVVLKGKAKRYGSTNADAKVKRDELMAKYDAKKKDVAIEQVEIGSDKASMMTFINELCKAADKDAADE